MAGQYKPILVACFLAPAILAGCKGGGDEGAEGGTGRATNPTPSQPITNSQVLLTSFVSSLDSLRSSANRLLTNDSRYSRQSVPDGAYVDKNRNGRFDRGTDVSLDGHPIADAGIHYAHAAGLTGRGQVIAFSDAGFLTNHEAFGSRSITTGSGLGVDDHGTFVASVAAGNSDDMIGVAPEADLIFGAYGDYTRLSETANAAAAADAVALNNSWGFTNLSANSSDYNVVFGSTAGTNYLTALRNYAREGVVIFAVSNDQDLATAGLMSGLPRLVPSLEQSWLAVVNAVPTTSGDDVVAGRMVSGSCLEAAAWCIAANGSWTGATSGSTGSYSFGTGSSYAAPTVAGAMALLAEAFPDLSNHELRIRLLASADNDFSGFTQAGTTELVPGFRHAYSSDYGHGFLDVAAALLPIGQPTVTTGNGTVISTAEPLTVVGSASGDAVARALNDVEIIGRDSFAGAFAFDASQLVAQRAANPLFELNDVLFFDQNTGDRFGSASFFGASQDFEINFADAVFDVSLFQGREGGSNTYGFGLRHNLDLGLANLEVGAAVGDDTVGLLSDWNGGTNSSLSSLDMALSTDVAQDTQITMAVGYAMGREASALGQSADILMNSSTLSFARKHAWTHNDSLSLSLSLPAAVYSGSTSVALPVRDALGTTSYRDFQIDLSPAEREMRLSLSYERPIGKWSKWGVSLAHAQNRGNIAGLRETAVMLGLKTRF